MDEKTIQAMKLISNTISELVKSDKERNKILQEQMSLLKDISKILTDFEKRISKLENENLKMI